MSTSNSKVLHSLKRIGDDENLRMELLSFLKKMELSLEEQDVNVRDEITGPLIDALHENSKILKKKLANGLVFHFLYRSQIARDFVMSYDDEPDHVWEPQTTKLLLHLGQGAKHVAIGGAYSGDQAILIANQIRKEGVCHCFEPNDEQIQILKMNARENSLDNVRFNRVGLWENDDQHLILVGEDSEAHPELVTGQVIPDHSFPTISLNTYGARNQIDAFSLIMLDIEGAELSVFKGADHFLNQSADSAPNLVFEVHRNYVDWSDGLEKSEIVEFLSSFGYSCFAVRDYHSNVPMHDQPIEIIRPEDTYLEGPPHGFNMLAVKDEKILEDPAFYLCEGVSPKLLKHRDPKLHSPLTKD